MFVPWNWFFTTFHWQSVSLTTSFAMTNRVHALLTIDEIRMFSLVCRLFSPLKCCWSRIVSTICFYLACFHDLALECAMLQTVCERERLLKIRVINFVERGFLLWIRQFCCSSSWNLKKTWGEMLVVTSTGKLCLQFISSVLLLGKVFIFYITFIAVFSFELVQDVCD